MELADLIDDFLGEPNHSRCFLHVINLVAKTIIKLFDAPKKGQGEEVGRSDTERMLAKLAEGIELEAEQMQAAARDSADGDNNEDNNEQGWQDEVALLSDEEREKFIS